MGLIIQAAFVVMVMGLLFAGWVIKRLVDPASAFRQNVGICALLGAAVFITVLWIRRSNAGERRCAPAAPPTNRFDELFPRPAPEPCAYGETQRPSLARLDWFQFEKLVEVVMSRAGYPVLRSGGANADGGIDLMIEREGEKVGGARAPRARCNASIGRPGNLVCDKSANLWER